ncbi:MAG: hypothetical protein B5M51_06030 [Anaerolinea sp. 4484_236]|nr:MAG: hypothetical protein B5M51_06030 [Anaerolinea sp. 4484_236]
MRLKLFLNIGEKHLYLPSSKVFSAHNALSIVCDINTNIASEKSEKDWACIKVLGPLDFALTGILARISNVLAEAEISIFALSTYDTDYVLVKSNTLLASKKALKKAGYIFEN